MLQLESAVSFVTGAASGIGKGISYAYAREGAKVVLFDRDEERVQQTEREITECGGIAKAFVGDVVRLNDVEDAIERTIALWGRIDIVVNNAGIATIKPLEETSEEEWDRVIDVNLKGIYNTVRCVIPYMKEQRSGVIINIASVAGIVGQERTPSYCAAKGGVIALTRALALDYAAYGIRVNAIAPGFTDTPLLRRHFASLGDPDEARRTVIARIPLGRLLRPEDIAEAAVFLASNLASAVTGIVLVVDGGLSAGL